MSNDEYQQRQTFMKRETGYYWVKMLTGIIDNPETWECCFWDYELKEWRWFGNNIHEQQEVYEFTEINETRILNPDEK